MHLGISIGLTAPSRKPIGTHLTLEEQAIVSARAAGATLYYLRDDLSNAYVNTSGIASTPSVGGPVGLVLDPSTEPQLGPELVANGSSPTTTAGWLSANATIEAVGGEIVVQALPSITEAYRVGQIIPTQVGRRYVVRAGARAISAVTSRTLVVRNGVFPAGMGTVHANEVSTDSIHEYAVIFVATTTQTSVYFDSSPNLTGEYAVSSLSVREVLSPSLSQATTGFKPLLKAVGSHYAMSFDGADDQLNDNNSSGTPTEQTLIIVTAPKSASTPDYAGVVGTSSAIHLVRSPDGTAYVAIQTAVGEEYPVDLIPSVVGQYQVWELVAATPTSKVYLDGVEIGSLSGTFTPSAGVMTVGYTQGFYSDADVMLVSLCRGPLSEAQRKDIARFGASLAGVSYVG